MKFNPYYSTVFSFIALIIFIIFCKNNYKVLSSEEGWGLLAMIVFFIIGVGVSIVAHVIEFFIRKKNK
jgi:hypothetical protein